MTDFSYRRLEDANGVIYRVVERDEYGGFTSDWFKVAGSIDYATEEEARREVLRLAKVRKGYIVEVLK